MVYSHFDTKALLNKIIKLNKSTGKLLDSKIIEKI